MAEILGRRFKRWENNGQPGSPIIGQEPVIHLEEGWRPQQPSNLEASTAAESVGAQLIAPEDAPSPEDATSRHVELVEGPIAASGAGAASGPLAPLLNSGSEPVQGATPPGGMGGVPPSIPNSEAAQARAFSPMDAQPLDAPSDDDDDALLGWAALPDLVIVDGGKGQLSAALDVMRNLGLKDVPLAGLAKQNEELFVQDLAEPIILPRTSQALYLVQRIRDEAHRFAITYHRKVRSKSGMESALDSVPGVGPKRKRALLRKFGSLRGVREASVEDIASTLGFTRSLAEKVKQYL
jgi:hypothetical protein